MNVSKLYGKESKILITVQDLHRVPQAQNVRFFISSENLVKETNPNKIGSHYNTAHTPLHRQITSDIHRVLCLRF